MNHKFYCVVDNVTQQALSKFIQNKSQYACDWTAGLLRCGDEVSEIDASAQFSTKKDANFAIRTIKNMMKNNGETEFDFKVNLVQTERKVVDAVVVKSCK